MCSLGERQALSCQTLKEESLQENNGMIQVHEIYKLLHCEKITTKDTLKNMDNWYERQMVNKLNICGVSIYRKKMFTEFEKRSSMVN